MSNQGSPANRFSAPLERTTSKTTTAPRQARPVAAKRQRLGTPPSLEQEVTLSQTPRLASSVKTLHVEVSHIRNQMESIQEAITRLLEMQQQLLQRHEELHERFTDLLNNHGVQQQENMSEVHSRNIPPDPPKSTTTPLTYAEIVKRNQGNDKPATGPHRLVAGAQPLKMVGHPQDKLALELPQLESNSEDSDITIHDPAMAKLLTLPARPPPSSPKTIKATPIRISRTVPRVQCPASKWREALLSKNIKPITILWPHASSVEILILETDLPKMKEFLKEIGREIDNPNPYTRRDGRTEPLPQETIVRTIKNRIRMLHFERSIIGARYIQTTIEEGFALLEDATLQEELAADLQSVIRNKLVL